jgi:putative DNA primase/helicase
VAKLKGARVVFASETEAGQRFAMARIKALTGGDEKISARFMRQEWFNFVFNGKINLLTNHRPKAPHDEKAFWNRICPIPFTTTFKLDPTVRKEPGETLVLQKDPDLNKKLEAEELPGILARMVKESVAWAERGLEIPAAVTEEKAKYKAEQNPFPHFFADCTVQVPEAKVTVADMQKCYADWSAAGSRKAQSSYRLRDAIMALGGIEKKRDWQVPGEPWTWFGIGLVAAPVAAEKDAF